MRTGRAIHELDEQTRDGISAALGQIPSGLFILTSQHEDRRSGLLVHWVQQVCFDPPMISVAIAKGRLIMPLISESRQFALCQLKEDDRIMVRKFSKGVEQLDDPFLGYELCHGKLHRLPILANTLAYMECELVCHMDFESDHDLFVGEVKGGARRSDATPCVQFRQNGFSY